MKYGIKQINEKEWGVFDDRPRTSEPSAICTDPEFAELLVEALHMRDAGAFELANLVERLNGAYPKIGPGYLAQMKEVAQRVLDVVKESEAKFGDCH